MQISLDDITDYNTPQKLFFRAPKKYTNYQSQVKDKNEQQYPFQYQFVQILKSFTKKLRAEDKGIYFEKMIKDQNKKIFINNFIKKLKRTIIPQRQYTHPAFYLHQKIDKQISGIQIAQQFQLFYSIIQIITISFLLLMVSLSMVFDQFHLNLIYEISIYTGFVLHIIEIIKQIFTKKQKQNHNIHTNHTNIYYSYFKNHGIIDFLVLIAFLFQLSFNKNYNIWIIRMAFSLKIFQLMNLINYFQLTSFQSIFWQQVWQLIKLILINYIFAHFLCLILISMAKLSDHNWMTLKGIQNKSEGVQYVWSYYWATTIMLTVGFGDITPVSTEEAFCLIFIQTISCMLLAFNINKVGKIIQKIRSFSNQQQTNLKTFRHLNSTKIISPQLQSRISNYIIQSVQIKRTTSIEQQNKFIQSLPNSFRIDLLKQCNKLVLNNLIFLKNLSQKIIFRLSIKLQKKMGHPQQVIHQRKNDVNLLIFGKGQIAYTYYQQSNKILSANGKIVQSFPIKQKQFKLLSLDFLFNRLFPFNVKCLDYTILYKMQAQQLVQILKQNPYDYEYFCMIKQKDKFILNQFQNNTCKVCINQRHYLNKCPKLHYIPLRQHVIRKFIANKISHNLMMRLRIPRVQKKKFYTFLSRKVITKKLIVSRKKIYLQGQYHHHHQLSKKYDDKNLLQLNFARTISKNYSNELIEIDDQKQVIQKGRNNSFIIREAATIIKNQVEKVFDKHNQKQFMWEIQSNIIHDFKYYFKKYTAEDLCIQLKRKRKKKKTKNIKLQYQNED